MRRRALLIVVLFAAVPLFAAAPEVTLPVAGRLEKPGTDVRGGEVYYTELAITNHRDVEQRVAYEFIGGDHLFGFTRTHRIPPKATWYGRLRLDAFAVERTQWVGALRLVAVTQTLDAEEVPIYHRDPAGQIEAKAFIVHERGRFAINGTSRQEVEAVPIHEYTLPSSTFFGVIHQPPDFYTNVGITNLHETQTVTFIVQFRTLEPITVTVGPKSSQQIRISGGKNGGDFEGTDGRYLVITPEWATSGGTPTPWVAYASTVDGLTGDAFTAERSPFDIRLTNFK